jgi:hypothetical protein
LSITCSWASSWNIAWALTAAGIGLNRRYSPCEDVGICCRSIVPKCREESENSGIGMNKGDGTINRNVFVGYSVRVNRRKEPNVQL